MPTGNSTPSSARKSTLPGKLVALGGVALSCAYLANLTAGGVIPLEIPDFIPGIGNLDEVFFSGVLIASLAKLGINVIPNFASSREPEKLPPAPNP